MTEEKHHKIEEEKYNARWGVGLVCGVSPLGMDGSDRLKLIDHVARKDEWPGEFISDKD